MFKNVGINFPSSPAGGLRGHSVFLIPDCCYECDHSFFIVIGVKTAMAKCCVYRYVPFHHNISSEGLPPKNHFKLFPNSLQESQKCLKMSKNGITKDPKDPSWVLKVSKESQTVCKNPQDSPRLIFIFFFFFFFEYQNISRLGRKLINKTIENWDGNKTRSLFLFFRHLLNYMVA